MEQNEICEIMGYLCNPRVDMRYDVQVPDKKRFEFESDYQKLTGVLPCDPGTGGYSVLGKNVDKYSVQYRISYLPIGCVPSSLRSISKVMPGSASRKRVSNKVLLLEMLKSGFLLGSSPSSARITSRISPSCFVRFEFGYVAAFSSEDLLNFEDFSTGFSSVDATAAAEFVLYDDDQTTKLVASARIGRSRAFRQHVLKAYNNQCCVCNGSLVDLLKVYETEAAHIVPKRLSGSDDIRNGLGLCRKHHWAFDRGMFGINDDYRVMVPDAISSIRENASLGDYKDALIQCPREVTLAPHRVALDWHRKHVFSMSH